LSSDSNPAPAVNFCSTRGRLQTQALMSDYTEGTFSLFRMNKIVQVMVDLRVDALYFL